MTDEHAAVQVMRAFDTRDFERARALLTDETTVTETPTGEVFRGAAGVIAEFERWIAACSDANNNLGRIFGAGDMVVMEGVWAGTHDGDLVFPDATYPASGARIAFPFATVARERDGRYVEGRHYYDLDTVTGQLGVPRA